MFCQLVGVLLCSVVGVLAAPAGTEVVPLEKQQPTVIPIVSQSEELESNGTYKFSYETANGIKREEISFDKVLPKVEGRSGGSGEGKDSEESNEIHVQQGSYSYTAPDGTVITLSYIADENGFRPVGDHLPKAPALIQQLQAKSEKSGRALDNAESGSSPAVVAAKVAEPAKIESRTGSDESKAPASKTAEEPAPTTAATDKPAVNEVTSTTTEQSSSEVSTAAPELTTEAASTSAPSEATSTPSPASSEASTQTASPTTTA